MVGTSINIIILPDFDAEVNADNFELLGEALTLEAATYIVL